MFRSIITRQRHIVEDIKKAEQWRRIYILNIHKYVTKNRWDDVAETAAEVVKTDNILKQMRNELEDVTALVDGMERIEKRMEELEKAHG